MTSAAATLDPFLEVSPESARRVTDVRSSLLATFDPLPDVSPESRPLGTNTDVEWAEQQGAWWQTKEEQETTSAPVFGSVLLVRLEALLEEEEEDAYGRLRPTPEAFESARRLLHSAEPEYGAPLPAGSVSTDSKGGIRITWIKGTQELQLICPADSNTAHLYYERQSDYGMEHGVNGRTLAEYLRSCE